MDGLDWIGLEWIGLDWIGWMDGWKEKQIDKWRDREIET